LKPPTSKPAYLIAQPFPKWQPVISQVRRLKKRDWGRTNIWWLVGEEPTSCTDGRTPAPPGMQLQLDELPTAIAESRISGCHHQQ